MHEWDQLLRCAAIEPAYRDERLVFLGVDSSRIRATSCGEVREGNTLNPRTSKPETGGLLCETVFGPSRDWHCYCGKYYDPADAGKCCERCGVDITVSAVRRVRSGHIELTAPVVHPWYLDALPGWLSLEPETVRRIVDLECVLVASSRNPGLQVGTVLSHKEWRKIRDTDPQPEAHVLLGAEAIESLLHGKPNLAIDGIVLRQLPVLPPDLRPVFRQPSGAILTTDLNVLYQSVLNQNTRLRRLSDLNAPEDILIDGRQALQDRVTNLLDNERSARPTHASSGDKRVLVSVAGRLTEQVMRGTTARAGFLTRPLDYSGRTPIVVGETPDTDTIGLPKRLAQHLFEPLTGRRPNTTSPTKSSCSPPRWVRGRSSRLGSPPPTTRPSRHRRSCSTSSAGTTSENRFPCSPS